MKIASILAVGSLLSAQGAGAQNGVEKDKALAACRQVQK
jgi:hypothetical protein